MGYVFRNDFFNDLIASRNLDLRLITERHLQDAIGIATYTCS